MADQNNLEYVAAAIKFETQSAPFPAAFFLATTMRPSVWWKGLKKADLQVELLRPWWHFILLVLRQRRLNRYFPHLE